MKTIGKKYHLAIGAAVAGLLFLFGSYLPGARRLQEIHRATADLNSKLDQRNNQLSALKGTFNEVYKVKTALASFEEAIPKDTNVGHLLELIDQGARQAGLRDRSVIPSKVLVGEEVNCLPIEISFRGEFEGIFKFLRRLESAPRVARVQRLEIVALDDSPGELTLSMTVHVYYRPA